MEENYKTIFSSFSDNFPPHYHTILAIICNHATRQTDGQNDNFFLTVHVTEYCAVIGPALHSARQQTAVKEVTRPLLSLAEWGVATRD